jgi:hypothetical protein
MSNGEHSVGVARTIDAPLDIQIPRRPEPICHRPSVRVYVLNKVELHTQPAWQPRRRDERTLERIPRPC